MFRYYVVYKNQRFHTINSPMENSEAVLHNEIMKMKDRTRGIYHDIKASDPLYFNESLILVVKGHQ